MRRTSGGLSIFAPGASNEEPKIKAIEIAALLQEKYAFLSGAQAKNGSLIITMPEHPKFGSLSDRDAERIFRYLVGLAREDLLHRGFMLVLDRRREKWGTVKSCLNKVQKCFPAKINLVCLLKPRGFLQKHSKPDFVTDGIIGDGKIQVVSLNSVAKLDGYIEKSQLTEDMGGTLDYKHTEWVECRAGIESIQKKLQTSSNRIDELQQGFTRTTLSPSVLEIQHILESQKEMWHDVKEDIESSRQIGGTLLDCITVHHRNNENTERVLTPDVKANAAELREALTELESLENNFEKFWKSHKLKLEYGLKVCLFEREISQTKGLLLSTLGNLSAMVDFGDSKDDAESLLQDLKEFAEKSVELLEKAKSMISKGTRMMESNDQSKDQIKLKCDETRELCDKFEKEVQKREEDLKKAMDIHKHLEMVNKWCKTGVHLLATQPIDRFQSSKGAEKALEEIENFLKGPQWMNMAEIRKMTPMSNALGNKTLISKVKDSHKRISEVNDMLAKRETSFKNLVAKGPVQPVSGIPANPPKREELKHKHSITQKSSSTPKSPVIVYKERKKSSAPESTGKRPVSIVLEPRSFQKSGSIQQSLSELSMQTPSATAVKSPCVEEISKLMWLPFGKVKEAVSTEQAGLHNHWKSASILSSATKSSENGLSSRSQSLLSVVGPNIVGGSNRVSNIQEFDDDEGCDTDEWDSTDSSDHCATQEHQQQQTESENMINIDQDLPSKGSQYSASASYTALESTELSFQQGDILELLRVEQDGWWHTRHTATKKEGWVPASYLDLLQS